MIDDVPDVFKPFVEEPAFTDEDGVPVVTACLWREATDDQWHHGTIDFPPNRADPDGTAVFCSTYWSTAHPKRSGASPRTIYEVSVNQEAVGELYALRPLDQELVSLLNAEVTLADLAQDISEIGYPQAH
ncbi:hypothetical protein [Streptomyces sp. NPDC057284]|uniref:hypothetical protein n=1 Tax=Streptomyces sp. NPDC057284 TaxID=3346083 RepID=UPI0036450A1B